MKKSYLSVVYDEGRTPKTRYPYELVRYLAKRFNLVKGMQLLEIGCGRGDFLKAFCDVGFICTGIDKEKKELGEIEVVSCDITKEPLPFKDESFDILYHKSLIEHLSEPSHLMSESYRVLKRGGKLIVLTPDWVTQMKNFYEDFTHCRPYTPLALNDLLTMYNLKNVVSEKFYQLPVIWKYPFLIIFSKMLSLLLSVNFARWLTEKTKIKFFRFSIELMILGYGKKGL